MHCSCFTKYQIWSYWQPWWVFASGFWTLGHSSGCFHHSWLMSGKLGSDFWYFVSWKDSLMSGKHVSSIWCLVFGDWSLKFGRAGWQAWCSLCPQWSSGQHIHTLCTNSHTPGTEIPYLWKYWEDRLSWWPLHDEDLNFIRHCCQKANHLEKEVAVL